MRRLPLVSPLDRAVFLKAQTYLDGVRSPVVAALAEHTDEREIAIGEHLFEADAPPTEIFFLSSGGVRFEYPTGGPFELWAPAGIGLMEHLARSDHPPAVVAAAPIQALVIDIEDFMQILEDDFELQIAVATSMNRAIIELRRELGPERPPEPGFPEPHRPRAHDELDLVERLAIAREAPLFRGSNLAVLTELLRFQEPRRIEAGEALWQAGDPVETLALVLDGCFVGEHDAQVCAYSAGATLGAWEVFHSGPRSESASALEAGRVIEIDRAHFTDVLEDHFEFACDYLGKAARTAIELRLLAAGREPALPSVSAAGSRRPR